MGRYFRSFFGATLISRAFGYGRDLAIAHFIGGGFWADIYFASFRLANLLRRLIGEGGLYAAYTPIYASILAKDEESAKNFAHAYAGKLFMVVAAVTLLGYLLIDPLTRLLLLGFADDPARIQWAIKLTAILMPFLACVVFAAWAQATMQAHGEYFLSSLSPIPASASIIAYLVFPKSYSDPASVLLGLAWATTIGGLLQYLMLLPRLLSLIGFHGVKSIWETHPQLKRSFKLFLPYVFTFSVDQLNSFLETFFGSFAQTGAIAALYNTSRLIQLPLGLIGVGSLVTTLPSFSKMAAMADKKKLKEALIGQRKIILAFCVPAVAAFILLAPWIIRILYYHGEFSEEAFLLTTQVLRAAAPSLLFYSLQKLYLSVFYANHDTKSPFIVSFVQLFVTSVGCILFLGQFGAVAIALVSSFSSFTGLAVMIYLIRRRGYLSDQPSL